MSSNFHLLLRLQFGFGEFTMLPQALVLHLSFGDVGMIFLTGLCEDWMPTRFLATSRGRLRDYQILFLISLYESTLLVNLSCLRELRNRIQGQVLWHGT